MSASYSSTIFSTISSVQTPPLSSKGWNWCTLVPNVNSVISESKRSELANLMDYVKADALSCHYRTPSGKPDKQLDEVEASLNDIRKITRNRRDSTVILGGDFNFGDIH